MSFLDLSPRSWILGALCAFFVGLAKTGVPGLGILVVPLMVLTVGDARHSAGWLLPILCTADVFAVLYYRRHAQKRRLLALTPWVVAGMIAGAIALKASEPPLRRLVGVIVLGMVAAHVWRKRRAEAPTLAAPRPEAQGSQHALVYGTVAGFATMVANAAGPVMNLYLMSRRLPKEEFIATGAWFFLIINFTKLPVYGFHGLIGARSLTFDAVMIPAVVLGALSGRAVFRRLPQRVFEAAVLVLTSAAAILLLVPPLR